MPNQDTQSGHKMTRNRLFKPQLGVVVHRGRRGRLWQEPGFEGGVASCGSVRQIPVTGFPRAPAAGRPLHGFHPAAPQLLGFSLEGVELA